MPIDANIYAQFQRPKGSTLGNVFTQLSERADTRAADEKAKKAEQAAEAVKQIFQRHVTPDGKLNQDGALADLTRFDPVLAGEVRTKWATQAKTVADADKAGVDAKTAADTLDWKRIDRNVQLLRGVQERAPQLRKPYLMAALNLMSKDSPEDAEWLKDGDDEKISAYISRGTEYKDRMTADVNAATNEDRDLAREQAGEIAAANNAATLSGQQVTMRGQDIGAATTRRGQDISASTAIRGQDLTDKRAGATDGGGKLSATAIEKVAGVDQSMGMIGDIERALPTMLDSIGIMDGRIAKAKLATGAKVDQPLAEFASQITGLKNAVIKATTGAAMSEPEAKRIMDQLPDLAQPEAVFRARLATTKRNLETLKRRTIELSGGKVAPTAGGNIGRFKVEVE